MGRFLSIDFGLKRTGLAVTDPLKIIASSLETIPTKNVLAFLKEYTKKEDVDGFVLGLPKNLKNLDTDATQPVKNFSKTLAETFPNIRIHWVDERFTSKMAMRAMIDGGMKKKDRRNKGNVDKISATIILQSFLEANTI